jgi:hypothetical protein
MYSPHFDQAETGIVEKLALSGKCTAHYPKEGGVHYSLLNDVGFVCVCVCRCIHMTAPLLMPSHSFRTAPQLPPTTNRAAALPTGWGSSSS